MGLVTGPGKKSLADQLAELADPTPRDYDPEDLTFTGRIDDAASSESDGDGAAATAKRRMTRFDRASDDDDDTVAVGYSVEEGVNDARHRIRPDIALNEGVYAGEVVSSRKVFDRGERRGSGSDSGSGSGSGSSQLPMAGYEPQLEFDSMSESSGSGSGSESGAESEHSDSFEAMEAQMLKLQSSNASNVAYLKSQREDEMVRARAALSQSRIHSAVLQSRVTLQQPLELGNRLPEPGVLPALEAREPKVAKAAAEARAELVRTLAVLGELEDQLVAQAPNGLSGDEAATAAPLELVPLPLPSHPRENLRRADVAAAAEVDLDELWEALAARQAAMKPRCEAVIDAWNRKAMLAGGMSFKNLKLKTLHRPLVEQIHDQLRDSSALRATSQKLRAPETVLSCDGRYKTGDDEVVAHDETGKRKSRKRKARDMERRSVHVYDDADFYQRLLQQLITTGNSKDEPVGGSGGEAGLDPVAMSRAWLARKQKLERHKAGKKLVDTRATKGRKLRFNVQPKLTNFMAPKVLDDDEAAGGMALLNGLFGYDMPTHGGNDRAGSESDAEETA
ncbi:apoptosis-antagonizing transcription factor [Thecamonas trahens ATCC 50062]|uniref:Apoptosis-antagonizing transcription factor n=1 Tax=Thecamonas trahens ATCC 50062 TaxID=461836 RepID=A0A0L0D394_THETB|nr:apoptosis-antagonizing transcription factor [Thecamonas trahens ATCC 50062]KNC46640.1 apoptosis-antagonizing transcription factor [Thecamonas trahens ATCC 50062]|eukprot:XP_013760413.1 apoptosis-antagonizing transcription factor [Thecamonas trahens ATCC 50062]